MICYLTLYGECNKIEDVNNRISLFMQRLNELIAN